jgi:Tfp pilus assembly protein PilV
MPTPARKAPSSEDGFIIIEVLVSALILAIVAGAVLTLITATTRSAASERSHSTAYGLAQEDQARMRTMRLSTLKSYKNERTETIGGTSFTVVSKAFFVNNKSGTASCTEQSASTDYVEITSTVSSSAMPNPVSLQGIISPTSSSIDSTHGSLVFQVNNALAEGVSGVSISSSGSGNPGSFSGTTESTGCAIFGDLPSGNYKVTATGGGLITPEGTETYVKEQVGAPAGGTQQVSINFDKAGAISPTFKYLEPKTGELTPAPVDTMELFNSENGSKTITFGTQSLTARSSTLEDKKVYPFKTKYKVYAGSCTSDDPDPKAEGINSEGIANVAVTGGGTATPLIRLPALNLAVTYNTTFLKNARVVLTDANCTSAKREYWTNKAGHIVNGNTLPELETETLAVGLPFGKYNICVSAFYENRYKKNETATVELKSLSSPATTSVSLSGSGATSSSSSSNQC